MIKTNLLSKKSKEKSKFFIPLFLFLGFNVFAQKDTIYFDVNWKTSSKAMAAFHRLKTNKMPFEGYSFDNSGEYLVGKSKWYDENGQFLNTKNYNYKVEHTSKLLDWRPIFYINYSITIKSQFTGGLEFCLSCEEKNKLFLGLGFGVTNFYGNFYGLPDLYLSYNKEVLFVKGGISDKHAYALAGITLLNMIDLGFGYSQSFNNDKIPAIEGFTFGTTFRFSSNQKVYTKLKIM
jgi:hypothetical protein